ncbi:hypothetical protein [Vibrio mangrovi]|uniref:Uncharacterized protein n=1 Tax=Vibrio mangrovi TaxID=474394 RepID=A0A1Y6IQH5_9VIBR|nr:hypothetical protein [Vibrio mangrovi]MDW6003311.1 hypothetical protein [Vibrio mangrovi]SMR99899.1 hypothetical protein VIM7927_01135 [Vibrio mangrovi]
MSDIPKPTNISSLNTSTQPTVDEVRIPEFPHTRPRGNGMPQILNTADNLATLLDHLGVQGALNEMTFELEILQRGQPTQSPDAIRSKIISAMSICDMPRQAIDDHLTALSEHNSITRSKTGWETGSGMGSTGSAP